MRKKVCNNRSEIIASKDCCFFFWIGEFFAFLALKWKIIRFRTLILLSVCDRKQTESGGIIYKPKLWSIRIALFVSEFVYCNFLCVIYIFLGDFFICCRTFQLWAFDQSQFFFKDHKWENSFHLECKWNAFDSLYEWKFSLSRGILQVFLVYFHYLYL